MNSASVKCATLEELFPFAAIVKDIVVQTEDDPRLSDLLPEERGALSAAAREKRRREYKAGRHLAREVLADLGVEKHAVVPDSRGAPGFPPGIAGSLTHTGRSESYVACVATSLASAVGLDAEEWRELSPAMVQRILAEKEGAQLQRVLNTLQLEPERLGLFAFSAKEAIYKCAYQLYRRPLNFHDVHLALDSRGLSGRIDVLDGIQVEVRWCEARGRLLTGAFARG